MLSTNWTENVSIYWNGLLFITYVQILGRRLFSNNYIIANAISGNPALVFAIGAIDLDPVMKQNPPAKTVTLKTTSLLKMNRQLLP